MLRFGEERAADEGRSSVLLYALWSTFTPTIAAVLYRCHSSSDEAHQQRCSQTSYPPALVPSPAVPHSSSPDRALMPSIPEPPNSSARMLAPLHPRSRPVRVVVDPRFTHPHPRCALFANLLSLIRCTYISPAYCPSRYLALGSPVT